MVAAQPAGGQADGSTGKGDYLASCSLVRSSVSKAQASTHTRAPASLNHTGRCDERPFGCRRMKDESG